MEIWSQAFNMNGGRDSLVGKFVDGDYMRRMGSSILFGKNPRDLMGM
jgi:hypothetical protein